MQGCGPVQARELQRPLGQAEVTELRELLATAHGAMSFPEAHGFLTGIASAPTTIMPSVWQPEILGESSFVSMPQAQRVTARATRRGLFVALAFAVVAAGVVTFVVATKKHTMESTQTAGATPIVLDAPRSTDAPSAVAIDAGFPIDARVLVDARISIDAGRPVHATSSTTSVAHAHTQAIQPQVVGGLEVYVTPWAMATLDGKSIGQTPLHLEKVSVGHHSLQIGNEEAGKRETISITITADQTTTIQRTW